MRPLELRPESAVCEAGGTNFTDSDVVAGRRYSYAIFAFDLEPNYSAGAVATTPSSEAHRLGGH